MISLLFFAFFCNLGLPKGCGGGYYMNKVLLYYTSTYEGNIKNIMEVVYL